MFKVGDRVRIIIPYYPMDWSFRIYYESRMVAGNTEPICTLVEAKSGKHIVDMYDKYVVYDERYYRKEKIKKICSKLEM